MSDGVVRALTEDGAFRVVVVDTTDTVAFAVRAQEAKGASARLLGELMTGAVLVRETMAPGSRVQGILKGAGGSGMMLGDAHPEGVTRGLAQASGERPLAAEGALLQFMRTLANGAIHQGIVEVEAGSIDRALMTYFQQSEQVETALGVACVLDGDQVVAAGGYLVQLLPEAEAPAMRAMLERLGALPSTAELVARGAGRRALVERILTGAAFGVTSDTPLRAGCTCSEDRVVASLATLPRAELRSMRDARQPLEIRCDFCRTDYVVALDAIERLLDAN